MGGRYEAYRESPGGAWPVKSLHVARLRIQVDIASLMELIFDKNGICYFEDYQGYPISLSQDTWQNHILLPIKNRQHLINNINKIADTIRHPYNVVQEEEGVEYKIIQKKHNGYQLGPTLFVPMVILVVASIPNASISTVITSTSLRSGIILWPPKE